MGNPEKLATSGQTKQKTHHNTLGVYILHLSTILIFDYGIDPTLWYFGSHFLTAPYLHMSFACFALICFTFLFEFQSLFRIQIFVYLLYCFRMMYLLVLYPHFALNVYVR